MSLTSKILIRFLDFKVAERYGMRLIREHTEAEGFPDCDFWYLMENDAER